MRILVTNDDGIDSPGLHALAAALQNVADVDVIAPAENRSAVGHGISIHKPLIVDETRLPNGMPAHLTDGTPSDCVRLAVLGVIRDRPDLVIAGINMGANLGDDITYSGTVSAALEGVINDIPSIAVSLDGRHDFHFETATGFIRRLVDIVQRRPIPRYTILNVNVPNLPACDVRGVEITRLGRRIYRERLTTRLISGQKHYIVEGEEPGSHPEDGTDLAAVLRGSISITPLRIDMTDYEILEELRDWPDELCKP